MPDKIIREIPLIARYSRHNAEQDYRFRAFLKEKLPLSNEELDRIVQETTDEVWKEIDCLTCANCCRTLEIVVDQADVARLSKRLGISTRDFNAKHVRVADDKTKVLSSSPCPFLGADNACTVYEDRPQACRDFPYLHAPRFRSRSLVTVENCAQCPIVFNVWQRLKERFGRGQRKT